MNEQCRICLKAVESGAVSILELLPPVDQPIYKILNLIGDLDEHISIDADDGFPQRICCSCYSKVKVATEFIAADLSSSSESSESDESSSSSNDLSERDNRPKTTMRYLKRMSKINVASQKEKGGSAYCEICDHTYCSNQELKRHRDRIHNAEKPFECDIDGCGKKFSAMYLVVRHKRETHHISAGVMRKPSNILGRPADVTCCCMCDFKIENQEELGEHVKEAHPNPVREKFPCECVFECQYCFRKFQKKTAFYRHFADKDFVETVVKRKQLRLKDRIPCACPNCGKQFAGRNDLYVHKQRVHPAETPFRCTFEGCKAAFALQAFLNQHLKDHLEKGSERMFVCEICAASFRKQRYLKKHMVIHEAGRDIKCPMCRLYFKTETLLEKHIKKHNLKFKKTNSSRIKVWEHKCNKCLRMFSHEGHLKMHERYCGKGGSDENKQGETSEQI